MAHCSLCGKDDLCYTCPYCNGVFCTEHRLPEGHGCPGLQRAKDEARRRVAESFSGQYDEDDEYDEDIVIRQAKTPRSPIKPRKSRFSKREIRDLGIAVLLVTLVGFALIGGPPLGIIRAIQILPGLIAGGYWWYPVGMIGLFAFAFLTHELAHKFVAQNYGMYSEFRMIPQGYYLSLIAILFAVPIFGTGVVDTRGAKSLEEGAKSTLAGPIANLVLGGVFLAAIEIIVAIQGGLSFPLGLILQYGMILNAMLGLFNMVPLYPFDGYIVMKWNRNLWIVATVALLAMVVMGYFFVPSLFF